MNELINIGGQMSSSVYKTNTTAYLPIPHIEKINSFCKKNGIDSRNDFFVDSTEYYMEHYKEIKQGEAA